MLLVRRCHSANDTEKISSRITTPVYPSYTPSRGLMPPPPRSPCPKRTYTPRYGAYCFPAVLPPSSGRYVHAS